MAKKAKKKYELAVPQWAKPAVKFIKKTTEPIVNAVMNSPQVKIIVNAVPKVVSPAPKSKRGESKKLPVTPKTVQPAKSAPVKKKDSPKREAKGMTWRNIKPADSGNAAQVNLQNKENSNNIKLSWEETVQMYVDDIRKGETHSGALRTLTLTSDPILSQLNNALNLSKIISSVADVSGVKGYYNNTVKSVEESFNDTGNQVYNSKIPFVSNFVGAFTNSSDYRKNGPLPLETEAENKLLAGLNYLYFSKYGGGILNHADPLTTYNSIKDNTNMASVIGANMGGAFINGGAKMADGMANMCLDPYGTIEGMLHMASNPKETLQSVSKSIETFSFHMVNADSQEKARLQGTLLFDVASIVMLSKLGKGAEGAKEAQGANEAGGLVKRGVSINKTEAEMANASRGAGGPGVAEGTGKNFKFSELTDDEIANIAKEYQKKSPIEIPEGASYKAQSKTGFEQISYKWNDGTYKYESRWHTRTSGAPETQGNTWVIQRTKPGSGGTKPYTEFLAGDDWVPATKWYDAIAARKAGTATTEQIEILDKGHWKE